MLATRFPRLPGDIGNPDSFPFPVLYLGVVPIARQSDGSLALNGTGTPEEWALAMKRFAQKDMFDRMADSGNLTPDLMQAATDAIASFHDDARPVDDELGLGWVVEENIAELKERPDLFPATAVAAFEDRAIATVERLQPILAARELETEGADLIATSCGFLGGLQDRLQGACSVPVLASALVILPWLRLLYGRAAPIGVLTFDSRALSPLHFGGGADGPLVVEGLEQGAELFPVISEDRPALDPERAAADAVAVGREVGAFQQDRGKPELVRSQSPRRTDRIAAATGLPVYDIITAISLVAGAHGGSAVNR